MVEPSSSVLSELREIDTLFRDTRHAVCCYVLDGYVVDPGPESCVARVLDALGDEQPRGLLLTHIHLDHAGGTGALVERWPDLPVWVHERGARHIVDPSRLVASATRIYGDDMDRLWGRILPVPEANVHVLSDGVAAPAGLRWAYTPGHASHHVAYLHEATGIVLAGDVAGVRIEDGPVMPPTPPPDIDIEAWHASIELVRSWDPAALAVTHYGAFTDVDHHLTLLGEHLDRLAGVARRGDPVAFEAEVERIIAESDAAGSYESAMPPSTLYGGLARYWQKRDTSSSL